MIVAFGVTSEPGRLHAGLLMLDAHAPPTVTLDGITYTVPERLQGNPEPALVRGITLEEHDE